MTDVATGISVATDRAVSIALIVNELITNAAKYAYENEAGGKIRIKVALDNPDTLSISVSDDGAGLAPNFDLLKARGLGMRIVTAFVNQLKASIVVRSLDPGTEFVISVPLNAATS